MDIQRRIVSLIPSATEIVAALGLAESLVGRSHECDYPPTVEPLPICTQPQFNPQGSSQEIHQRVTDLLTSALSVYQVKTEMLARLQPTHILTQAQCEVCAVSLADVIQAVGEWLEPQPAIVSLQPHSLADLWGDLKHVGEVLGVDSAPLIKSLQQRVQACHDQLQDPPTLKRPTVVCIEWTDPLMVAGHWVPELVDQAGGEDLLGHQAQPSRWIEWSDLSAADPDVLILLPCGYDRDETRQALQPLTQHSEWSQLRSVRSGHVYITDGNHYFNRPGPRLVDSLEILAEILHPDRFPFGYEGSGWERWVQGENGES